MVKVDGQAGGVLALRRDQTVARAVSQQGDGVTVRGSIPSSFEGLVLGLADLSDGGEHVHRTGLGVRRIVGADAGLHTLSGAGRGGGHSPLAPGVGIRINEGHPAVLNDLVRALSVGKVLAAVSAGPVGGIAFCGTGSSSSCVICQNMIVFSIQAMIIPIIATLSIRSEINCVCLTRQI